MDGFKVEVKGHLTTCLLLSPTSPGLVCACFRLSVLNIKFNCLIKFAASAASLMTRMQGGHERRLGTGDGLAGAPPAVWSLGRLC